MATFVKAKFEQDFKGEVKTDKGLIKVGIHEGELLPYDMLLGALLSCFYATFVDISKKMKLEYDYCELSAEGVKRDKPPQTLKHVKMEMKLINADKERSDRFERAVELAKKYCSVYQTLSKVSEMEVDFELA